MRPLTAKQENFCQAILDNKGHAEAYRVAYDCSNWTSNAVYVQASKMLDNPKVILRIGELKKAISDASTTARAWDLDRIVEESAINVQLGRDLKQVAASNGAITTIGKAKGLLIDRTETISKHLHAFAEVSVEQLREWASEATPIIESKPPELMDGQEDEI